MRSRVNEDVYRDNKRGKMTARNISSHDIALEYAKSELEESYRREESIISNASMQIAAHSFLITAIISLEIGLYENQFRFFKLSLAFSSITILTMLLSTLFAILSQWRFRRNYFPKTRDVVDMLNATKEGNETTAGKEQLIWAHANSADSMDRNNDKKTKCVIISHILAIISIVEMLVFSFIIFVLLLI